MYRILDEHLPNIMDKDLIGWLQKQKFFEHLCGQNSKRVRWNILKQDQFLIENSFLSFSGSMASTSDGAGMHFLWCPKIMARTRQEEQDTRSMLKKNWKDRGVGRSLVLFQ